MEVGFVRTSGCVLVFYFSVDSRLGLVFDPLANEELVFRVIEVTTLALALVRNPVTFKMIAVTLCEHTVSVALALVPLALVNVLV